MLETCQQNLHISAYGSSNCADARRSVLQISSQLGFVKYKRSNRKIRAPRTHGRLLSFVHLLKIHLTARFKFQCSDLNLYRERWKDVYAQVALHDHRLCSSMSNEFGKDGHRRDESSHYTWYRCFADDDNEII